MLRDASSSTATMAASECRVQSASRSAEPRPPQNAHPSRFQAIQKILLFNLFYAFQTCFQAWLFLWRLELLFGGAVFRYLHSASNDKII